MIGYFTDDAVYHNVPVDPVVGRDNIRAAIAGFTAGVDKVEIDVLPAVAHGEIVLTEGVDRFHLSGRVISLPGHGDF